MRTGGRSNDNRSPRGACRAREAYYSGYKLRCPARTTRGKRKNWQKNFPDPYCSTECQARNAYQVPHAHSSYSVLAPQTPYLSNNTLALDLVGNTTHAWFLPHFRPVPSEFGTPMSSATGLLATHPDLALSAGLEFFPLFAHFCAVGQRNILHWSMHTSHIQSFKFGFRWALPYRHYVPIMLSASSKFPLHAPCDTRIQDLGCEINVTWSKPPCSPKRSLALSRPSTSCTSAPGTAVSRYPE